MLSSDWSSDVCSSDLLLAPTDSGQGYHHLAVETARPQQSRVEHVGAVRGRNDQNALPGFKAVHFNQQLVKGLLPFVVAPAQARAALAANRVDFIDKDDARRLFLGIFEHIAHTRRAATDEHLDDIGA